MFPAKSTRVSTLRDSRKRVMSWRVNGASSGTQIGKANQEGSALGDQRGSDTRFR